MRPYILDEAWMKFDGEDFVFCSEKEGEGLWVIEFDLATDGGSWFVSAIHIVKPGGEERTQLAGRQLYLALSFYAEELYQEFAEHVRDNYEQEDDRAIERWKYAS